MSRFGGTCLGGNDDDDCVERGEDTPWSYNPAYYTKVTREQHYPNPPSPTPSQQSRSNVSFNNTATDHYHDTNAHSQYASASHYKNINTHAKTPIETLHHVQYDPYQQSDRNNGTLASTADGENRCSCVYMMFENFKWVKQQHYAVVRDGREYFDRYVVTYRLPNSNIQYDLFTYSEGLVHEGPIENRFKHLCGEVLSSHTLPPVNSLRKVCYYVPPLIDPNAPFHVQEEVCKTNSLTPVPLPIDTAHQVLVFRTFHDTLALQLMPSAFSEQTIVSGTPLFHGTRKNICATVGSMFSAFHYVINGSPCAYALFSVGSKEKNDAGDGDRMRLIVLDRRDRFDSEEWTANEAVLNSVSEVALPILQRVEGKHARLDLRDILYVGVINSSLQLSDAPSVSKKYKPPKNVVTAVIDNRGVYAVHTKDKEVVNQWIHKDSNTTYSILPPHFFDKPRTSVVRINTADTNAKLKRTKSREVLI